MRHRKGTSGESDEDRDSSGKPLDLYGAFVSKTPPQVQTVLNAAGPYVKQAGTFIHASAPKVYNLYSQTSREYEKLDKRYSLYLLAPTAFGFVMCFFGGSFFTLIAAIEAYRMCGYETSFKNFKLIADDMKGFMDVSKEDDKLDENEDGIADVKQISVASLAERKSLLFLKTVDPQRLTDAISGLNAGFLAVVATLKLRFACVITLGHSIANVVSKPVNKFVVPSLESSMPDEYRKWAHPIVQYILQFTCISTAWWVQRILQTVHAAMRGGTMISRNLCDYLTVTGLYPGLRHEETMIDEIMGAVLACLGIWFQLRTRMQLPFPLNILLFPLSIAEWGLTWIIGS